MQAKHSNVIRAANPTKQKTVGMEPTLQTIHDPSASTHKSVKQSLLSHKRHPNLTMTQKTNYAAPAFWGNSRREGIFSRRPPNNLHRKHNSRVFRYPNRRLAETTSNCLYKKTTPRKRTENQIHTGSRLQRRLAKPHKSTFPTNHRHQRTLYYNTNRQR